jgi:hypothetical protein
MRPKSVRLQGLGSKDWVPGIGFHYGKLKAILEIHQKYNLSVLESRPFNISPKNEHNSNAIWISITSLWIFSLL